MKKLSSLVAFTIAICALVFFVRPTAAPAADVTGTWALTVHYPPPDGDFVARYVLKQDGEKITGTYQGLRGPADVTGTIKASDVMLTVTVQSLTEVTAHFSGKVTSPTTMSGTVTGTSSRPSETWSAEKQK
jgi:multidrug efflux pump subunit AcrA (membrane-fusion protein)